MAAFTRALLFDFGSTFTKLRVVDLEQGRLLAATQAPSTVATDLNEGLEAAFEALPAPYRTRIADYLTAASSSAAGGLRIVAVGLVRSLTAKAAEAAALSAGGNVKAVYADGLTQSDVDEIVASQPDLLLLAGGTDGGDRACILANAEALAASALACPIVVAGNRNAAADVARILERGGKRFDVAPNVLPSLDRIESGPATELIRAVFMEHIVHAKGLDRAEEVIGRVTMPTPQAVLRAAELLSRGSDALAGWGDLIGVDVGGATTDLYSIAEGAPSQSSTVMRGLPDPVVKRTVEADLGMRVSARTLLDTVGAALLAEELGVDADVVEAHVDGLVEQTDQLPATKLDADFDRVIGRAAVRTAMRRHVGNLEVAYGPDGEFFLQTGKDLRSVKVVIGTGGILNASPPATTAAILEAGRYEPDQWRYLAPQRPRFHVDAEYVLFAAGLLLDIDPAAAAALMTSTITELPEGG